MGPDFRVEATENDDLGSYAGGNENCGENSEEWWQEVLFWCFLLDGGSGCWARDSGPARPKERRFALFGRGVFCGLGKIKEEHRREACGTQEGILPIGESVGVDPGMVDAFFVVEREIHLIVKI